MTDNEMAKAMYKNTADLSEKITRNTERKEHSYELRVEYDSGPDAIFAYYVDGAINRRIFFRPSMKNEAVKAYVEEYKHLKSGTKTTTVAFTASVIKLIVKNCGNGNGQVYTSHKVYDVFYSSDYFAYELVRIFENPEKAQELVNAVNEAGFSFSHHSNRNWIRIPKVNVGRARFVNRMIALLDTNQYDEKIVRKALSGQGVSYSDRYKYNKFEDCMDLLVELVRIYGTDAVLHHIVKPWINDPYCMSLGAYTSDIQTLFGHCPPFETYKGNMEKAAHDGYRVYDIKAVANYMFRGAKRQGFAKSSRQFIDKWGENQDMQVELYGRVKDKYPQYLLSMHNILNARLTEKREFERQLKEAGKAEEFKKACEVSKRWEVSYKGWFWRPFESIGELVDVANDVLHNCLETCHYDEKIANGSTEVILGFEKLNPDVPIYAIEIRHDANETYGDGSRMYSDAWIGEYAHVGDFWIKQAYADEAHGATEADLKNCMPDACKALQHMMEKAVRKMNGQLDEEVEAKAEYEEMVKDAEEEVHAEEAKVEEKKRKLKELQNVDLQHNAMLEDY